MPLLRACTAAACLAILLAAGAPAAGQPADSPTAAALTVAEAAIGIGGQYKSGFWTPLRITLQAGPGGASGNLEVVIPDGDRVPVIYSGGSRNAGSRVNLQADERQTYLLYAKTGPTAATIAVQLRDQRQIVWSHDITRRLGPPLSPTAGLIVGIGPDARLRPAIAGNVSSTARSVVQLESARELPDQWWGYDGVNAVVLTTSDAAALDAITASQREALIQWTRLGGRLVLSVGARGERFFAADSPWAALAPGKLQEVSPLRQGSGLESLVGIALPFEQESFQRNRPQVTRFAEPRGRVLVDEGGAGGIDLPLAIRAPFGFGEIVFVAIDLDHPSLAEWPGQPKLLASLLAERLDERSGGHAGIRKSVTHLGYTDLSGQLRAALDQFPGVTMVNFTTVSILTLVFLLLVGPGDYLLLGRLGWPRHWTWFSFPLVALLFGAGAWWLGGQSHGNRVRINQAEIIDIDLERQLARGIAWTHLYSPATQHYDLQATISANKVLADQPQGWLSWQGLPGDALGGLESRQIALATAEPYRVNPPGDTPGVEALPVQVASSKSLITRWWGRAKLEDESQLSLAENGLLDGEFVQPLPLNLTDCLLIHGERLYRIGKLAAGQRVYVADLAPLSLEARLTEIQRSEGGEVKLEPTAWRQDSIDVPRIVQMLMFHEAARGISYTGLAHDYDSQVELTQQVRLGRAILVGRAPQPVVELQQSGKPVAETDAAQAWTWYRILMPVALQPLEAEQP